MSANGGAVWCSSRPDEGSMPGLTAACLVEKRHLRRLEDERTRSGRQSLSRSSMELLAIWEKTCICNAC